VHLTASIIIVITIHYFSASSLIDVSVALQLRGTDVWYSRPICRRTNTKVSIHEDSASVPSPREIGAAGISTFKQIIGPVICSLCMFPPQQTSCVLDKAARP